MRYSQLFWDFDGTLVDTYPGMVAAFGEALVASGVNDFEIDQDAIYQAMRQHSLGTALQRFSAEYQLDVSRLKRLYQLRAEPRLADAPVVDGAAEILAATVAAGGRNFLLTHRIVRWIVWQRLIWHSIFRGRSRPTMIIRANQIPQACWRYANNMRSSASRP
ncbi:HAD hydrolase-like protein [Levilactobacillus brevis]|uniref:HAD hydrolase-like protein n=1 Tax=Levilactobacillus brevis TaxID=1580 RepID=UPI001CDC0C16|nr:haloacid dehalogenase-like hydrolase [Levilactobacillus brevis]